MSLLLPSSMTTPLKKKEKDNPEDPEGSEGSTAKMADSTNNMPTENDEQMTNSV